MSHQWSNEDFCSELEHVANLLAERPNSVVGHSALGALKQRLQGVPGWTASGLTELYGKVKAAALPQKLKEEIMQVMDALSVSQESNLQLQMKAQSLTNLPPYLTLADWEKINASQSFLDGMRVLCERLKALGIKSMKEDTKKCVIALLLHVKTTVQKQPLPSNWAVYYMVNDLVSVFASTSSAGCQVSGLKTYPMSPSQLSPTFLEKAYGNEKPAMQELSLSYLHHAISLRDTNRSLKEEPKAKAGKKKPPASEPVPVADQGYGLLEKKEQFMEKWCDRETANQLAEKRCHLGGSVGRPPATGLQGSQPASNGRASEQLPSVDGGCHAAECGSVAEKLPHALVPVETHLGTASLEDFEDEAYKKLASRRAAGKGMKRPAAAPSQVKPVAKARSSASKKGKPAKKNVQGWGCSSCRGNVRGCASCSKPTFQGRKFYSREEWKDWGEATGKK